MAMSGSAQDSILFRRLETKKGNWADLNVDNLGNFYLLSKDNRLKKINSRGDSVGAFNEVRRYGKLYSMDVTNPLKTLLYYRNFSTIIVLDRFMNIINSIDLRRQQIFQVKAIAQSYDNQIRAAMYISTIPLKACMCLTSMVLLKIKCLISD